MQTNPHTENMHIACIHGKYNKMCSYQKKNSRSPRRRSRTSRRSSPQRCGGLTCSFAHMHTYTNMKQERNRFPCWGQLKPLSPQRIPTYLRSFLENSRHPGPQCTWKGGSGRHFWARICLWKGRFRPTLLADLTKAILWCNVIPKVPLEWPQITHTRPKATQSDAKNAPIVPPDHPKAPQGGPM